MGERPHNDPLTDGLTTLAEFERDAALYRFEAMRHHVHRPRVSVVGAPPRPRSPARDGLRRPRLSTLTNGACASFASNGSDAHCRELGDLPTSTLYHYLHANGALKDPGRRLLAP